MPSVPSAEKSLRPLDEPVIARRLLAEVTGLEESEVVERLRGEQRRLGAGVADDLCRADVRHHVWSDDLRRFYEATDAFLFESFVWNRQTEKHAMRRWIGDFLRHRGPSGRQVLTFGDGLGFESTYLARAGHVVTYFEVGAKSRAFAREVFLLNDVGVTVVDRDDALTAGRFDVVVCLDVLEHVETHDRVVAALQSLEVARLRQVAAAHVEVRAPLERAAQEIAASRSGTSIMKKPASCSLVSA